MYNKVWGVLASQISIYMPQKFRVGDFLESLSLRQDIDVKLLKNLCAGVAVYRNCSDKGLCTTNIRVLDLEGQGLENFPEWREKKNEGGTGAGRVVRGGDEGSSGPIGRR